MDSSPYSPFVLPLPTETRTLFETFDARPAQGNGPAQVAHRARSLSLDGKPRTGNLSEEDVLDILLACKEEPLQRALFRLQDLRPRVFPAPRGGPVDVNKWAPPPKASSQQPMANAQNNRLGSSAIAIRPNPTSLAGLPPVAPPPISGSMSRQGSPQTPQTVPVFSSQSSAGVAAAASGPSTSSGKPGVPLVQFMTSIFFCNEDEGSIKVDIMRAGDLSEKSECNFQTRDLSATAGHTYVAVTKRVVFQSGQDLVQVEVPIIEGSDWDTTTEFAVELLKGDKKTPTVNATLGRYLWTARVKVIDNDCFPSSRYDDNLRDARNVHAVPRFGLFVEYIKLNWHTKSVKSRSIRCMAIDQVHNFYGFVRLFINVYLVDYVLKEQVSVQAESAVSGGEMDSEFAGAGESEGNNKSVVGKSTALLIVAGYIVFPFMILHFLDHMKVRWYGVGAPSTMRLQICLLRKFLNYNNHARTQITSGDLVMAMTRDASMVVADGYVECLGIVKEIGILCMMFTYPFAASALFGIPFGVPGLIPIFLFPALMACFLAFRNNKTIHSLERRNQAQNSFVGVVNETVENYRMIADYSKRELFVGMFQKALTDFNTSNRTANDILQNNKYFAKWLPVLFIAAWMILGGSMVPDEISIGIFLANINVCTNIGNSCFNVYVHILEIISMMPALQNVCGAMNLPTDLPHRKELNRTRRKRTAEQRALIKKHRQPGDTRFALDIMPIEFGDMSFTYITMHPSRAVRKVELRHSGQIEVTQGETVFFVGPRCGGKSTLLKIIGGELLPDPKVLKDGGGDGVFFVPSHLRVLHVSVPLFYDGTLSANMTFGCTTGDEDANLERVEKICKMLGVDDKVLGHLHNDEFQDWSHVFSETQCQLLSLGRALVANPEVLCIHKPTERFLDSAAAKVWSSLAKFVEDRGVVQALPKETRRPRTCICTVVRQEHYHRADKLFHVCEGSVKQVSCQEATQFAQENAGPPNDLGIDSAQLNQYAV